MHPWFGEYIHSQLEDFLPDPYEGICEDLAAGKPFSFSRFGDGELAAVFEVEGANCDGHRFFPELGRRLGQILEREPEYLMGLQTLAMVVHGVRPILSTYPGIKWVLADSLHNASMEGRLDLFFDALGDGEALLVGPRHLQAFSEEKGWGFVEVVDRDCWQQYEEVLGRLQEPASESGIVILFCASMMSNVLIDDLYRLNPGNTYIDAGSIFDPYVGIKSRAYHEDLSSDPLKGLLST